MPVRMTETAITKAIKDVAADKTRRDLTDKTCPGLRLRLTPAGAANWVLACRDRLGRMRRFPLGAFPDMGVSDARSASIAALRYSQPAKEITIRQRPTAPTYLKEHVIPGQIGKWHSLLSDLRLR
jgi:Arm DNA-binding domain